MDKTYSFRKLDPDLDTNLSFDCGDDDLNDFIQNRAYEFQKELIAVTYLIFKDEILVCFFSVFNDKISYDDFGSRRKYKKNTQANLPKEKHFNSYPAVKIGRLAVCLEYQKMKIGRKVLDFIKLFFKDNNKTGCKFVTVDAYSESLNFYEKNGFKYLTETDTGEDTRQMYFDLQI